MVDQLDRDYELVSHGTHPYQLFTYEVANHMHEYENEEYERKQATGHTMEEELTQYIKDVIEGEVAKLPEGEKLSLEKVTEITMHCLRKARNQYKQNH